MFADGRLYNQPGFNAFDVLWRGQGRFAVGGAGTMNRAGITELPCMTSTLP